MNDDDTICPMTAEEKAKELQNTPYGRVMKVWREVTRKVLREWKDITPIPKYIDPTDKSEDK